MAWLKDAIEYLERVLRWGSPGDGMEVALVCEEYVGEAERLACRLGYDLGNVPTVATPRTALTLLSRLEKWARENVPNGPTLTVSETARLLRVNRGKVLGWIASGRLKAMNTAKGQGRPRYRIARADLDLFLTGRTRQPAATPAKRRRRAIPDAAIRYFPES